MKGIALFLFVLGFGLLPACGPGGVGPEGELVGASCREHRDCDRDAFCNRGGKFPGGMCTAHCDVDEDCPPDTVCADRDGGVCLPLCEEHADCRRGYLCDDEDMRQGGKEWVCIGD